MPEVFMILGDVDEQAGHGEDDPAVLSVQPAVQLVQQ